MRRLAAKSLLGWIRREAARQDLRGDLAGAFLRNTKPWRSIFARSPAGWGGGAKRRLNKIREDTNAYVQTLNDRFTNPSGESLAEVNEPEPKPETGIESRTVARPEPTPEPEAAVRPVSEVATGAEVAAETRAAPQPDVAADSEAAIEPQAAADAQVETGPRAEAGTKPGSKAETTARPKSKTAAKLKSTAAKPKSKTTAKKSAGRRRARPQTKTNVTRAETHRRGGAGEEKVD
jgi:hypothetical protein